MFKIHRNSKWNLKGWLKITEVNSSLKSTSRAAKWQRTSQDNSILKEYSKTTIQETLSMKGRKRIAHSNLQQITGHGKVTDLTQGLVQEQGLELTEGLVIQELWMDLELRDSNNQPINRTHSNLDIAILRSHSIRWTCSRFRTQRAHSQWILRNTRTSQILSNLIQPHSMKISSQDQAIWELERHTRMSRHPFSMLKMEQECQLPQALLPHRLWSPTRCLSTSLLVQKVAQPESKKCQILLSTSTQLKSVSTIRIRALSETKSQFAFWT